VIPAAIGAVPVALGHLPTSGSARKRNGRKNRRPSTYYFLMRAEVISVRVLSYLGRQHFDGHIPLQTRVPGAINLSHAPCPERFQYFVMAGRI